LKEDAEEGALSSPAQRGRGTTEGGGGGDPTSEDPFAPPDLIFKAGAPSIARRPLARSSGEDQDPDAFPNRPDLILIDGGLGQYNATKQILDELGVTDVAIVGIAKGRDRDAGREMFFVEGKEPFRLAPRDPALYFVQRLRDEAHRFAIGTHRARRKKDFTRSPLDDIGGIGPARKRALLHAFGTAKALSRAALADLEKVPGINAGTAKLVYDFFNERNGA
jgi:excinuclease ABC subunit C